MCKGKGKNKKMAEVLYACQVHYDGLGFPKEEETGKSLFQKLLIALYNAGVVEEEGFGEWRDADEDDHIPGKSKGLVQSTDFFAWLDEPDEESEEEDEDEEEDEE